MTRHSRGDANVGESGKSVKSASKVEAEPRTAGRSRRRAILFLSLKNLLFWGSCIIVLWLLSLLFL